VPDFRDASLEERAACRRVPDLETVDAAAAHQRDLVGEHVAGRADLAFVAEPLAQQPRRRIASTVGEFRKDDGDHLQA
jgi:hypothetical protein